MSTGAGLGMGLFLSGPEAEPTTVRTEAIDPDAPRSRRYRPGPPDDVAVPRHADARHGLPAPGLLHPDLQAAVGRDPHRPRPARDARPPYPPRPKARAQPRRSRRVNTDLENDLLLRAESDDLGDLKVLRLGEATLPDLPTLGRRLRRYIQLLDGRPLRVRLVADDRLRYEPAAQIIATCSAAGVSAIRLAPPAPRPNCRRAGIAGLPPNPERMRRNAIPDDISRIANGRKAGFQRNL